MATANQIPRTRRPGRRLILLAAVLLVVAGALLWVPLRSRALTGAAFGARIGCACRYVEGRGLQDCRKDFEPGMAPVMLSEDEETHTVTARFLLLARATAEFRPGQGCSLEPWRD